ncbi:ribosome-associated heat shock protein Hsp15 [Hydrocarboniphaga daqingensis]|jgi:ribosome-associated heat shock protein Hsp15|uniref:Heat shock protein 15 n=1 Tax=Hydrocarboniphaga daqingensis TaxID=490188 RepID=A0A1M5K0X9_9GAMM|nr:S4 domain-containing protein [Hydrocarboniphaga daqingensis]SHG46457.1 ribosome-associated heat shock protein Hsp15 [Hydrocarboniphaga daqingensis]
MSELTPVRLDKWLWAARFYKTRTLAQEAIDGGKVRYEGDRAKPAKSVALNAHIRLRQGYEELEVVVKGLSDKRGSATIARQLYEETEASRVARERAAEQRRIENASYNSVRPDKKQRRLLDKLKRTLIDTGQD